MALPRRSFSGPLKEVVGTFTVEYWDLVNPTPKGTRLRLAPANGHLRFSEKTGNISMISISSNHPIVKIDGLSEDDEYYIVVSNDDGIYDIERIGKDVRPGLKVLLFDINTSPQCILGVLVDINEHGFWRVRGDDPNWLERRKRMTEYYRSNPTNVR